MKKGYFLLPLLLVGVVGCGASSSGGGGNDPRQGWVDIGGYDYMKCSGTTMLFKHEEYSDDVSITSAANDPRCGGSPQATSTP